MIGLIDVVKELAAANMAPIDLNFYARDTQHTKTIRKTYTVPKSKLCVITSISLRLVSGSDPSDAFTYRVVADVERNSESPRIIVSASNQYATSISNMRSGTVLLHVAEYGDTINIWTEDLNVTTLVEYSAIISAFTVDI